MNEEWRPVVGLDGQYEVSSRGRVVSLRGGRRLVRKLHMDASGYLRITIKVNGRTLNRRVHSLVAESFIGPRPSEKVVRHIDGNHLNNDVTNLRYGTSQENAQDMLRHGRHRNARKTSCQRGNHPFDEINLHIAPNGTRHCRACHAESERDRRARQRAGRTP